MTWELSLAKVIFLILGGKELRKCVKKVELFVAPPRVFARAVSVTFKLLTDNLQDSPRKPLRRRPLDSRYHIWPYCYNLMSYLEKYFTAFWEAYQLLQTVTDDGRAGVPPSVGVPSLPCAIRTQCVHIT